MSRRNGESICAISIDVYRVGDRWQVGLNPGFPLKHFHTKAGAMKFSREVRNRLSMAGVDWSDPEIAANDFTYLVHACVKRLAMGEESP